MKKLFILLALFATAAYGQLKDVQEAGLNVINFATNPGFENGLGGWTVSGGNSISHTSGSFGRGQGSALIDIDVVNGSAGSPQFTVSPLLADQGCLAHIYYSSESETTWQAQVLDGSFNILNYEQDWVNIPPTPGATLNWRRFQLPFACPSSGGTASLQIRNTAGGGLQLVIDELHMGTDYRVGVSSLDHDFRDFTPVATWTGNVNWTSAQHARQGVFSIVELTAEFTGTPTPAVSLEVDPPPGCTPNADYITKGVKFNGVIPLYETSLVIRDNSAGTHRTGKIHYDSTDVTATPVIFEDFTTFEDIALVTPTFPITLTTGDAIYMKYKIPCEEYTGNANTVTADQAEWKVSGYITGQSVSMGIVDNGGTFLRVAASSAALVLNDGSAPAEIPCEAPTPPEGLTCNTAAVNENIGIAFTIPYPGTYAVRFKYGHTINASAASAILESYVKLGETSETSATIIQDDPGGSSSHGAFENSAITTNTHIGIFEFGSAGKKVIRAFENTEIAGSPSNNFMRCDGTLERRCYFEVWPLKPQTTAPISCVSDTLDVSSTGSFNAAQPTFKITKCGSQVNLTFPDLAHSSTSFATTGAGFIPLKYRPTQTALNNVYGHDSSTINRVIILNDGDFQFSYRDYTGSNSARTNTSYGSATWSVD